MTWETRLGAVLAALLVALAVVGSWLGADPRHQFDLANGTLLAPSAGHWLGTDQFSRDVLARLAHGARISLTVAVISVAVATSIGTAMGLAAGATDRAASRVAGRLINLGLALPRIVVLLVLLTALGVLPLAIFAGAIGATGWPAIARLVRGETLRVRHLPYVAAAHALGAPISRVMWREFLPSALPAVLVAATLGVADAILLEAGLSFLGLGMRAPTPSWGVMLLESRLYLTQAPWLILAPCVALVMATSAATLLGDGLRRSLQPDTR